MCKREHRFPEDYYVGLCMAKHNTSHNNNMIAYVYKLRRNTAWSANNIAYHTYQNLENVKWNFHSTLITLNENNYKFPSMKNLTEIKVVIITS